MFTNNTITHFEKQNGYKSNAYDVYLEAQSSSKDTKEGETKSHALFISVPTDKEISFNEGDLIVVGKCLIKFDNASERAESDSYKALKNSHKIYTISSVAPCLFGSRRMWHYELECD